MALIVIPYVFSAGAVIIAAQHNSNFSTIVSDYNGNIDNTNIVSAAGILGSKLNLAVPGIIGGTTPAAGTFTNLTGTIVTANTSLTVNGTLNVGSTNQGDILYDNGTHIVRLTPGTSGQVLKTQGSSANPIWTNGAGIVFVSNTAVATASNSGDISITNTNYYMVVVQMSTITGNDNVDLRINNDSTSNYKWVYSGLNTSAGALAGNSTGDTSIHISPDLITGSTGQENFCFYIMPQTTSNGYLHINGNFFGNNTLDDSTSSLGYGNFYGGWLGGSAATSFRILRNGGSNWSGTVLVYQLKTS